MLNKSQRLKNPATLIAASVGVSFCSAFPIATAEESGNAHRSSMASILSLSLPSQRLKNPATLIARWSVPKSGSQNPSQRLKNPATLIALILLIYSIGGGKIATAEESGNAHRPLSLAGPDVEYRHRNG